MISKRKGDTYLTLSAHVGSVAGDVKAKVTHT